MKPTLTFLLTTSILMATPAFAADPKPMPATEAPAAEASLAKADKDMKAVLDAHASLKPKPIETLSPAEARKQPSPADGAKLVMKEKGMNPADPMGVVTKDIMIDKNKARLYMPEDMSKKDEPMPVIVYYHGGGWVIADIDTYDATPRAIAKAAKAIVISAEYRHAPEHKFPAAHDDAFAAYQWALANAAAHGGDPKRVAVMGESAGGNLAINTAIKARDSKVQLPVAQVLVYPVAGVDMNTESYQEHASAKPLNKAMMGWFVKHALKGDKDKQDPRIDLNGKADLAGLPPTTIILAEIDPLRTDGERLAEKLAQAGVKVDVKSYEGVTHEFFGMGAIVEDAKDAQTYAVKALEKAFD